MAGLGPELQFIIDSFIRIMCHTGYFCTHHHWAFLEGRFQGELLWQDPHVIELVVSATVTRHFAALPRREL